MIQHLHTIRQLKYWLLAAGTCFGCCLGCDQAPAIHSPDNLVQVEGQVTLDKQPLTRTGVLFLPIESGSRARGMTDDNGEFRLLNESEVVGITPGEYLVVFQPLKLPTGESSQSLDSDYRSPDSTPVRATITENTKSLRFQLTKRASDFRIES